MITWNKLCSRSIFGSEQYCESLQNAKKCSFPKALDNITKAQKEMKRCYELKLNKRSQVQLNIGDQVLYWNSRKERMQPRTIIEDPWIGPFEVVKAKLHIVYIFFLKIHRVKRKFIKKASLLIVKRGKELSQKSRSRVQPRCVSREKVEFFCVTWSASHDGNKLVNTCSRDNFIT